MLRPHKDAASRGKWFMAHRGIGSVAFLLAMPTLSLGASKLNNDEGTPTIFLVGYILWCVIIVGADYMGSSNGGAAKGAHNSATAVVPEEGGGDADGPGIKKRKHTKHLGEGAGFSASAGESSGSGMPRMGLFCALFVSGAIMIAGIATH